MKSLFLHHPYNHFAPLIMEMCLTPIIAPTNICQTRKVQALYQTLLEGGTYNLQAIGTIPKKVLFYEIIFLHRWLSLSTNCVEKISNLNALSKYIIIIMLAHMCYIISTYLENLKILSLGRNNIKNLTGLVSCMCVSA